MSVFAMLLAAHGLSVAALVAGLARKPLAMHGRVLGVALGAAFPVAGPLVAWGLLARGPRAAAWHDDLPAPEVPLLPAMDARGALARELAVRPFADRLRAGDRDDRQAAARALASLGGAGAVRVLEAALGEADADTRLFASISLVRLEAEHAERLGAARAGGDPLALARAVRAYLASGLPRGAAARALWAELGAAAEGAIARAPERAEAWLYRAAAHRALDEPGLARDAALRAYALAPKAPAALEVCEALWAAGDLAALPAAAERLAALTVPGSPAHQAARFWLDA